jgi:hypothetical protein
VRSYISKEQQEAWALQFFQENLPNVSVVWNDKQDELELKWKGWDDYMNGDQMDDKISRSSITSLATASGFHFSGDSGSNVINLFVVVLLYAPKQLARMIYLPHVMCAVQKNFIESSFDFNNFVSISWYSDIRYFCRTPHNTLPFSVAFKNWSELPEGQMTGAVDSLQTPGVCV